MNLTIYNTESAPLPIPEAHKNFVMADKRYYCSHVTKMNRTEWCDFSKETKHCSDIVQLVNYVEWISCSDMSAEFGTFVLFMISILLMLAAYSNARSYAPNMVAVLYYMNIEEYNAGSLFVNIVNNTPHLLLWLNYGSESMQDLKISDILGASLTYLCFTGVFFCFYPLQVPYKWFCKRDVIYQCAMITYVLVMCLEEFNFMHAYAWLIIHVLYLIICSMENFLISVFNTVPRKTKSLDVNARQRVSVISVVSVPEELPGNIITGGKNLGSVRMMKIKRPSQTSDMGDYQDTAYMFTNFFRVLNPYRHWDSLHRVEKVILVAATPFRIVVKLCVPQVDLKIHNCGWSKLLVATNIIFSTIVLKYGFFLSFHQYIYQLLLPSVLISLVIFGTSTIKTPPSYHHVFALYGICVSWTISLIIFNEMLALNYALRIFFGWDKATSNFSIIAWGYTVEGLITNFTFASMKFKYIAFGALLNAPVMLIVLEFSMKVINYMVTYGINEGKVKDGAMNATGIFFMIIGTCSMTIISFLTDFSFRRSVGVFFIIYYGVFLTFLYLSSYGVIHPYGVDHDPYNSRKEEIFWA